MTFEFVIIYSPSDRNIILNVLRERLREVLETSLNDVEADALNRMVWIDFERSRPIAADGITRRVLGFSLMLQEGTTSIRDVVDGFVEALRAEPIEHVVKCEDPLLRAELEIRATELFSIEMKLRRVLSIIYLHAYPESDPYELLKEETVQPMASAKPQPEQMKVAAENQFFHLTFGQYVGLNQRPAIKDLGSLIRNEVTYEAFREELLRQPVQHEDDAAFLAGLKERMDSIEKMRNAVAHNRRPSRKVTEAYQNALPLVSQALDDYLYALATDWRDENDDAGWPWDDAAQEAVEQAMESAHWNEEDQTIAFDSEDEMHHMPHIVANREELQTYLEGLASSTFYAYCSRDEGEWVAECDEESIVEGVLAEYEDRLKEFFTLADDCNEADAEG